MVAGESRLNRALWSPKSNMATADQDGNQGMNRFELLEQSIEQFIETTRQIGIIVSDVQPGSQGVLNQKM